MDVALTTLMALALVVAAVGTPRAQLVLSVVGLLFALILFIVRGL